MMPKLPESDIFASSTEDKMRDDWLSRAAIARAKLGASRNPYVGNKKKILVDFAEILYRHDLHKVIDGGRVLDVFSGSAFVGYLFKHLGAAVWSNDVLASSFLNSAAIVDSNECLGHEDFELLMSQRPETFDRLVFDNGYVPSRFTEGEADRLDQIRTAIEMVRDQPIEDVIKHIELSAPFDAYGKAISTSPEFIDRCIMSQHLASLVLYVTGKTFVGGRLNKGQVLAELEHRIKHVRNKGNTISFKNIPYCGKAALNNGLQSVSTRLDIVELFENKKPEVDMIYLDPPYGGEQSNYAKMYSFFEFWLGQKEGASGSDRFTMSKSYEENFMKMLSVLPTEPAWVLSYNESSWANIEKIKGCISEFRDNVQYEQIDYRYNYRKVRYSGIEYVVMAL